MASIATFEYTDSEARRIVASRNDVPSNVRDILGAVSYDGVQLNNGAYEFKNDPRFDPKFTQSFSERNAVAFLLIAAGYREFNLVSQQPPWPDVLAEFANHTLAYIETAEVVESPSARLSGFLNFINVGIRKALFDEPQLDQRLDGHFIGVRAWMPRDGNFDPRPALTEFLTFLRTSNLTDLPSKTMVSFGNAFPALSAIDAKYYHSLLDAKSAPRFDPAAHSFAPESLAQQILPILQQKRAKAHDYRGDPLWLALYMSDHLGDPELSLDSIQGLPLEFAPFRKLLIGDQRNIIVYSHE